MKVLKLFCILVIFAAFCQVHAFAQVYAADEPTVTILGQGAVPVANQSGTTEGAQGSLGLAYAEEHFQTLVLMSSAFVPSTVSSSDQKAFGQSMLRPEGKSQALILDVRGLALYSYFSNQIAHNGDPRGFDPQKAMWIERVANAFGLHGYASFSSLTWEVVPPLVVSSKSLQAFSLAAGLDISVDILRREVLKNRFLLCLDLGVAVRSVFGEISGDATFRQAAIGTSDTAFWGFESGLTLAINGILAKFTYINLSGSVPGLTNGDITVTIGAQLGVLQFSSKTDNAAQTTQSTGKESDPPKTTPGANK